MDALNPSVNSVPIASIVLRKNSERNDRAQLHSIPANKPSLALAALRYARILSDDVTAVHVSIDPAETEKLQKKWKTWGEGTPLVILDSPYRLFIEPLLTYIVENSQSNKTITIVVPQFIPSKRWHSALHMPLQRFCVKSYYPSLGWLSQTPPIMYTSTQRRK